MARGVLKYFFERDTSLAHVIGGISISLAIYHRSYVLAVAAFVLTVVVCVIGELALERR